MLHAMVRGGRRRHRANGRADACVVDEAAMSALQFIQGLTQALYILISIVVTITAVRRPTRVRVDIALFFGVTTLIIAQSWASQALNIPAGRAINIFVGALLMALPYLLLRLVNDFTTVPTSFLRAAEVGLALATVSIAALSPLPLWVVVL